MYTALCSLPERIVLLIGAICLIIPGLITDIIGIGAVIAVYLLQKGSISKKDALSQ
jgi:UPF0716 family protein affecting phage T7 exclusion